MTVELKVPVVGESIAEVQIAKWLKAPGERAEADEKLVVIETDKATFEMPAPVSGVVTEVLKAEGQTARVGETIGRMDESAAVSPAPAEAAAPATATAPPAAPPPPRDGRPLPPSLRRAHPEAPPTPPAAAAPEPARHPLAAEADLPSPTDRAVEAVPMTLLRKRVAERLVSAQHEAALLTTFNEADMSAVIALRRQHRESYERKHGVKLGFMSFFVKSAIFALQEIPRLNAQIRGDEIIYHHYCDVGIAVGSGRGLIVPVLRNAERMSFAEIEKAIADFSRRAQDNQIRPDELQGGTFTISNGGVYGSLLSTPIVNPPQSGVLGMHAIQERPVARDGQVVVRPMMYLALTYDHRLVDGREAVTFLKTVKELIEDPARIMLEV